MKTVIVTGGAGYIGSHACKALAAEGYQPVTYDNLVYGYRDAVKWGPFEYGDIRDTVRLSLIIRHYKPVAFMHFAAFAYVGESVTDPAKYYANNTAGALSVLEAMRLHDIPAFVFSSTCATYGTPPTVPISETTPQVPINPYGASKLMVEQMLRDFDPAYGLKSVALRYFNAAGADPDGEIGENHNPETHLIPLALQALLGAKPLKLFGTDYPTPDGTAVRDYIHVSDLAAAHVRALDYLLAGGDTTAINLGTGVGHSVRAIIGSIERVTGKTLPVEEAPRRAGDPPELVADSSLSRNVLKLNYQNSADIDFIIDTAWRWHKNQSERALA